MRQPTLLRSALLLSVLLLTACAVTTSPASPTALPPPTAAPTQSASAPTATIAPTSLAATAAPTTSPSLAEQEGIADNRTFQQQPRASNPQPLPPIRPRLLRTFGMGQVVALALSPNGQFLAVGTTVGWGLYTVPDLQQVRFEELALGAHSLIWSASSRRLAVVSAQGASIYRFPEGTLASIQLKLAGPLIFSPDGKTIASIYTPTRSWAASVGRPPQPSYVTFAHSDAGPSGDPPASLNTYGSVTFSPDNALLATEGETDTLLWKRDASSTLLTSTLLLRVPGIQPTFSPNGRLLATTMISDTGMIVRLWRVPSGQPLTQLAIGPTPYNLPPPMAFRHDGTRLALIADKQLQLWNIPRGTLIRTQVVPNGAARLSPDAQTLVTYHDKSPGAEQGIRFTRIADGHVLYQDKQAMFDGAWDPLTWSADGTFTAYLTSDGRIHVIDLARGTTNERAFPHYTNSAFSPDGQTLAVVQPPETVALWRVDDPAFAQQRALAGPVSPNTYRILDRVEFTPDGQSLVAQEYDLTEGSLRVAAIQWDLSSDQPGRTVWELHQTDDDMPVRFVDTYLYSPAAHAAAWANKNGIQLQREGGPAITIAPGSTSQVIEMTFSADGRVLAASDNGGSIRLFSIEPTAVTLIQTLSIAQGYGVEESVLSPDGTLFGLPDDGIGKVWRVGEGAPPVRFGFEGGEGSNAVSRFSIILDKQLLIAVRFNNIGFYRLSDGRELGTLPLRSWGLGLSLAPYESVAISPAGDRLAVTSDGRILLWDIGW